MKYPFHMPGHKRNASFLDETDVTLDAGLPHPLKSAYRIDTTETPETDDLHDAKGILKAAENRANALYCAAADCADDAGLETHFLINGATAGVLAAVSAVAKKQGAIVAARNAHRSFYHAVCLNRLRATYILPQAAREGKTVYPFFDGVDADAVEAALKETPDAAAVFITSPTYEGVVSDIEAIVRVAHAKGVPVVVDEAHGAHFSLDDRLPKGAIDCGADIVVHSVHKTLASLTQTALIHAQGSRVDRARLRFFLRVYQSSSPSYVLMASLDGAVGDIAARGKERFSTLLDYRARIAEQAGRWKRLRLAPDTIAQDPCKLVVLAPDGCALANALRETYEIEVEMATPQYVVCILTPYDTAEGVERLILALADLDAAWDFPAAAIDAMPTSLPAQRMSIADAIDKESEDAALTDAYGRVSADFIYAYPPGVPLIAPGEVFDAALCDAIKRRNALCALKGVDGAGRVRVVV